MSKKTAQPALYEMMRTRPSGSVPAPVVDDMDVEPANYAGFDLSQWLSPGRTVRLPVGYMFLIAAITVVLIWFAYMVGASRGKAVAKHESDNAIVQQATQGISDPLMTLEPSGRPGTQGKPEPTAAGAKPDTSKPPAALKTAPTGSWGPVVPKPDPRKKGMRYFVLAETNPEGALQLAEFCRSNGLESYVVSGKNDKLRRVVCFPGFDESARSSSEVKALENLIHTIGEKWKKTQRGATDLRDAYPSQYSG